MKLGRLSGLAAVGIIAAGTITGSPHVEAASAASYTHLCSDDQPGFGDVTYIPYATWCADSYAGKNTYVNLLTPPVNSLTNWTYPNTAGATGAIRQANTNYCIQLDESAPDGVGGYWVTGASCVGDKAEQWVNVYNSAYGHTVFESLYDPSLCLTAVSGVSGGISGPNMAIGANDCTNDNNTMPWEMLWATG